MCGLSLAWVTSENSTSTSNADILSRSSSLDPILSPTVSGVQCWLPLSVVPRQLCFLASLLSNANHSPPGPPSTASLLSSANCSPPGPPSTARQLLCPANSYWRPLTTSGYGEISCPRILCLVSRQNRQRNRLLWRPTHIVLQGKLFVCQNPIGVWVPYFLTRVLDCASTVSHFHCAYTIHHCPRWILVCIYTIYLHGQMQIFA